MIFKSDKLDYLRGPRKEKIFDKFFSIGQGPINAGKLKWNLLVFCCSVPSFAPCLILKVMIMSTMKPKNFKGYLPVQHGEWIRSAKLRDITYLMTTHKK